MSRRDIELLLAGLTVGALLGIGVLIVAQWLSTKGEEDENADTEVVGFAIEGDS